MRTLSLSSGLLYHPATDSPAVQQGRQVQALALVESREFAWSGPIGPRTTSVLLGRDVGLPYSVDLPRQRLYTDYYPRIAKEAPAPPRLNPHIHEAWNRHSFTGERRPIFD